MNVHCTTCVRTLRARVKNHDLLPPDVTLNRLRRPRVDPAAHLPVDYLLLPLLQQLLTRASVASGHASCVASKVVEPLVNAPLHSAKLQAVPSKLYIVKK